MSFLSEKGISWKASDKLLYHFLHRSAPAGFSLKLHVGSRRLFDFFCQVIKDIFHWRHFTQYSVHIRRVGLKLASSPIMYKYSNLLMRQYWQFLRIIRVQCLEVVTSFLRLNVFYWALVKSEISKTKFFEVFPVFRNYSSTF